MAVVKKIVGLVAIAALTYFSGGWGASLAGTILGAGASASAIGFLGAVIGAVIVAAGTYIIMSVLGTGGRAPDIEAGKVNVRISDPPRWINGGRSRSGGGALFGEFDGKGRFWYIIVHSDEILHPSYQYFLDDEPVTLDGSGYVYQKEFRLKTNKAKDPAESDGQGRGYVRIWTTTYSETDPTPPRIAALDDAFPTKWTSDHRLAGTTFSVICMDALDIEHRYKIYRWRGAFGLGEPAVSIAGDWANMYDPRDVTQVLGDRTTYKASRNAALVWAWFRTHKFGRNKPESTVNWERIAEQADICDQNVTGIEGDQKRYEAGVAIVDSKRRVDAEKEILLSMDGQIVFDEDGKSWVRAGAWEAPTLSFSRNRDIMAMSSVEAQDGESETQGVIVNYIEPAANYTVQPSAAWINPLYYDPLTTPKFLTVDIQACQNHNQAMRLAKGIGMRSQPRHKIGPTVNLRGLQARHERIVTINYDNTFAGDYEIATPVELDGAGIFTGFGAVPVSPSRWTLLPGEEQPKPVVDGSGGTISYPAITGESVYYSEGAIKIDFPVPDRDDVTYVAEYILTSEITGGDNDPWRPMAVNVNAAVSGIVPDGDYTVRYRYVTSAGNGPAWEYATISPSTPMPVPNNFAVSASVTQAVLSWRNPLDLRFFSSDIYRGTTAVFGSSSKIVDGYGGGPGALESYTDTPASAGTYYYWVVATDGGSIESTPTGPEAAEIGAFDFMGGTMPSGASIARSGSGTRITSAGALATETSNVARLTYDIVTHSLLGLLLEGATTNLLPNNTMQGTATGAIGGPGALPTGWTISTAAGLSREVVATGQINGFDYVDIRFHGTPSATSAVTLTPEPAATVTTGTTWTNSVYLSLVAGSWTNVSQIQLRAADETAAASTLITPDATLRRYSNTRTLAGTGANQRLRWNYVSTAAAVDFTLRIAVPQRESGSVMSSVIKTGGSTASLAAETLSLNWGARGVADGAITMRVTFENGSTQDVAGTVSSGTAAIAAPVNRQIVGKVARI